MVAQAPLAETGHRLLMRALAARGDAAAALAAYDQLRQLLREELGVSPCPATQALHARLLHGQPLEEPARPVPPARSARSGSQARSSSGAQAGCRGRRAPGGTGRWNRRSSRSGAAHCRQWAARSSRPPCRSPATTGRSRSPSRHPSPRRPGRTRPRTPAAPAAPRSHPPGCGRTWDPASVTLVFSSDPELCRSLSAYETSSRVVAAGTSGGPGWGSAAFWRRLSGPGLVTTLASRLPERCNPSLSRSPWHLHTLSSAPALARVAVLSRAEARRALVAWVRLAQVGAFLLASGFVQMSPVVVRSARRGGPGWRPGLRASGAAASRGDLRGRIR